MKNLIFKLFIFLSITIFSSFINPALAHNFTIGSPNVGCGSGHQLQVIEQGPTPIYQCIHISDNTNSAIGVITPPGGTIPETGGDPSTFVASLVRNGIWLMVIVAFVIAFIWIILAGLSFVFAGDDPKKVQAAWGKVYWGLIGLVIVIGSFAIIKLVETFFGITVISGGFQLPT